MCLLTTFTIIYQASRAESTWAAVGMVAIMANIVTTLFTCGPYQAIWSTLKPDFDWSVMFMSCPDAQTSRSGVFAVMIDRYNRLLYPLCMYVGYGRKFLSMGAVVKQVNNPPFPGVTPLVITLHPCTQCTCTCKWLCSCTKWYVTPVDYVIQCCHSSVLLRLVAIRKAYTRVSLCTSQTRAIPPAYMGCICIYLHRDKSCSRVCTIL